MATCELPNAVTLESCLCDTGTYDIFSLLPGQTAKIDLTVLLNGVETDPDALSITVTDPAGVPTTYVYSVDANVVRDELGRYYANVLIPAGAASVGVWSYEWAITGSFTGTLAGTFNVYSEPTALTITVEDSGATPVPGARVDVFGRDSGMLTLVASGVTDALGQFVPSLTDGLLLVSTSLAGWRFPDANVTKVGAVAATVTGTDLGITAAPTFSLCRLYGHITWSDGRGLGDVTILVRPVGADIRAMLPQSASGVEPNSLGIMREPRELRSRASDGYWECELVQGSEVEISVPSLGWTRRFRVPVEDALSWADIRPDPSGTTQGVKGTTPK